MNTKPHPNNARDHRGQFKPGTSGNPEGRPRSDNAALRAQLAKGAEDVLKAILTAATQGDMQAAKIVIDRILPPIKAAAQPVRLDLPDTASPLDTARAIITATASGAMPPDIAAQLVAAVGTFCRIEDVEDLRERIDALEKATRPTTTQQTQ